MRPIIRFCLFLTGLLLLTGVAGCTTRHDQLAELGFTRNYLDGYQDGCSSRKEQTTTYIDGFRRDPERMMADMKYASGWTDGFEQCYADNTDFY